MDVFGYRVRNDGLREYKVVEIKTGSATPADLSQLIGYVKWITEFLADNDGGRVKGFLIGKDFDPNIADQVEDNNALRNSIRLVQYCHKHSAFQLK